MQLLCLGDVALADKSVSKAIWDVPAGLIPNDDVKIILNWEFPIGDAINPQARVRGKRFTADSESPQVVQKWGPGIATLATNHILDAKEEGLARTMSLLQQVGFTTVGAGMTVEEISRPLFWETKEGTLAIINWVFPETHPDWMATPGPNCWPGPDKARNVVREIKHKCDWVMAVLHWSDELFAYPLPNDRKIARDLASLGVDIVIGHHPHVVRGMETIGLCPVFYSLGNFYFAEIKNKTGNWISQEAPRNREGLGVNVLFQRGRQPQYQLLSFWNTRQEVVLDPKHRAEKRFEWASIPLRKFQNEVYARWYKTERTRFDRWGSRWHFGVLRRGLGGTLRRMIMKYHKPSFISM